MLAVERGFALEDADGGVTHLPPLWDDDGVGMNEGGCDPDGRFYCGSMAYDARPGAGTLYRLDPDGLTVDALGGVRVALLGRSAVWRFDPDGRRDEVIELRVSQVTACTFGGPDLDRLFITTSWENLADDAEPLARSLFVAEPGVRGLPVLDFAG